MRRVTLLSLASFLTPVALTAQQRPLVPHDSVQGAVRAVDMRARSVEVTTGVGFALRVLRLQVPPTVPITSANGDEVEHMATWFPRERAGAMCDELADKGGPVFQDSVTPALHAALGIDREPRPPSATIAERTTPDILGFGLLDAVPDSV